MSDRFDLEEPRPRIHARRRRLGRLSVFLIGLTLGLAAGACVGALGWTLLRPVLGASVTGPTAPASRTPAAKSLAAAPLAAGPTQALNIAPGKPIVVGVFGDSMGDGLWQGLYRRLRADKAYQVVRFSQASTGLTRYGYVDVQRNTADQLAGQHIDVAVVLFGANDEQDIASGGVLYPFGGDGWRRIYTGRMDALVALLRAHGAAVYWVGLPKMKRAEYDRRAGVLNALYQAQAAVLGVPFVDTVPVTVTPQGAYDDYLNAEDTGRPRLMRAKDGIHMTPSGYLRLAGPISALLQADVAKTLAGAKAAAGAGVTLAAGPTSFAAPAR